MSILTKEKTLRVGSVNTERLCALILMEDPLCEYTERESDIGCAQANPIPLALPEPHEASLRNQRQDASMSHSTCGQCGEIKTVDNRVKKSVSSEANNTI